MLLLCLVAERQNKFTSVKIFSFLRGLKNLFGKITKFPNGRTFPNQLAKSTERSPNILQTYLIWFISRNLKQATTWMVPRVQACYLRCPSRNLVIQQNLMKQWRIYQPGSNVPHSLVGPLPFHAATKKFLIDKLKKNRLSSRTL